MEAVRGMVRIFSGIAQLQCVGAQMTRAEAC